MARVKRRGPGAQYTPSAALLTAALSLDAWRSYWGGEAEARRAWEALRDQIPTNRGTRPAPWWAYQPGIPAELREMANLEPPPDVQARALRRLLGEGQDLLMPGETEAIRRVLRLLEEETV